MISSETLRQALPQANAHNWREQMIRGIKNDSRQIRSGDLFVAVSGVSVDGHRYIGAAKEAGATAFVVERLVPELADRPTLVVEDAREAVAWLHAAWHGYPARKLKVIGVTGTDGKTTTTRLISNILRAAGRATGSIDTVTAMIGHSEVPTGFHTTTPDAPEMQAYLAQMVEAGIEYAVIEATSHGLAQRRVTGCEFDVAVVTNITHEHLDYHGTYEAYRAAKAMLFESLNTSAHKQGMVKTAVLNADDSSYAYLSLISAEQRFAYGVAQQRDVYAEDIEAVPSGLVFRACTPEGEFVVHSPLVGRYNVHNMLAAIAACMAQGVSIGDIQKGISAVQGIPGRMERIDSGQPFTAIVDFAHTPYALESALKAVRDLTDGQVIVVFGCAGLRDFAKRRWMGRIAGQYADRTIITAEDPRTESLEDIMEEIAAGCREAGCREESGFWRIGDRGQAVRTALKMALPGDLVIVTGKGHEQSMCFGTTEYPWSDQDVTQQALREMGYASDVA